MHRGGLNRRPSTESQDAIFPSSKSLNSHTLLHGTREYRKTQNPLRKQHQRRQQILHRQDNTTQDNTRQVKSSPSFPPLTLPRTDINISSSPSSISAVRTHAARTPQKQKQKQEQIQQHSHQTRSRTRLHHTDQEHISLPIHSTTTARARKGKERKKHSDSHSSSSRDGNNDRGATTPQDARAASHAQPTSQQAEQQ